MAMVTIEKNSPAKVNLRLKVTSRRSDGYHELDTLFIPLSSPADKLTINIISHDSGISLNSSDSGLPTGPDNICCKAVQAYLKASGIKAGVSIELKKIIPVAAGLGGGSSNAAAVLSALNEHFQALPVEKLMAVAVSIGADVPFFINGRPATAQGIGEQLDYLDFDAAQIPVLVAAPDFPVSAAWAYQHLTPENIGPAGNETVDMVAAVKVSDWEKVASLIHNDLAFALYDKFPIMTVLKAILLDSGALNAEVSGSGPSMFAIYPDKDTCRKAAEAVKQEFGSGLRTFC